MIKPGAHLFWCPEADDGVARAREFCKIRGLGTDDIRMVRREKDGWGMMIVIETKRECRFKMVQT